MSSVDRVDSPTKNDELSPCDGQQNYDQARVLGCLAKTPSDPLYNCLLQLYTDAPVGATMDDQLGLIYQDYSRRQLRLAK
jgi:hypothetical protein